jgi:hypothetical protein
MAFNLSSFAAIRELRTACLLSMLLGMLTGIAVGMLLGTSW